MENRRNSMIPSDYYSMKALILVGGFGTRLRPFSFTKPKPLVEFCNLQLIMNYVICSPIVFYQLRALSQVGVKQVILAVSYMPQQMVEAIPFVKEHVRDFIPFDQQYGIDIIISVEDTPMGTGRNVDL